MKARNLLKILFTMTAVFAFTATFAQQLNDGTDDLPNLAEDTDETAVEEVTAGYTVPYYVTPDPVLNSGFSEPYEIGGGEQGLNSTWSWTLPDANGSMTQGDPNEDGPYVEVEWDNPGTSGEETSIEVQELGPSGSCTGDTKELTVEVYDPPSFEVVEDGSGTAHDLINELCATDTETGQDVLLEEITDNGVSGGNFKFRLDIMVDSIDSDDNQLGVIRGGDGTAQEDTIVEIGETYDNEVALLSGYEMPAIDGQITRYRFDFGDNLYGNGNSKGITDHIQRKSQYLSNPNSDDQAWDYIADEDSNGDGSMITFIIYPAPETGNIHYVPNDFDL